MLHAFDLGMPTMVMHMKTLHDFGTMYGVAKGLEDCSRRQVCEADYGSIFRRICVADRFPGVRSVGVAETGGLKLSTSRYE